MRIITVSREFGSGGRELGRRLADALHIAYYDREIITTVSERSSLDETYIEKTLESGILKQYPVTISRSFAHPAVVSGAPGLLAQQHKVIQELAAQGDCVIVGRGADAVLQNYQPLKLFVYADMPAKMERCRSRAAEEEKLSDRELKRKIRQIDLARAGNHDIVAPYSWGDKHGYHLCINTTGIEIKSIIPHIAEYAKEWFERKHHGHTVI